MTVHRLKTPISEEKIRELRMNDILYISGTVVTARDKAHQRALRFAREGKALPVRLEGLTVFHCGPVMRKRGATWIAVAAGPTTSTRMEKYQPDFIKYFRPRLIVGKGGMGKKTTKAMSEHGAAYGAFTGGAAVLAAKSVKKVVDVKWLDLGMPEAMWVLKVQNFGPLVAAIDTHGNNAFMNIAARVDVNRSRIFEMFE